MTLMLNIATGPYDRVRAIQDGRIQIRGCSLAYEFAGAESIFRRAFDERRFDVCELSFSFYVRHFVQDAPHYIALPVFLSRLFRHSGIYIRTDRGIVSPGDLRGRRIGVPNYLMTGAVWQRGLLSDDHSVSPVDIDWCTGGLDHPQAELSLPLHVPGISLSSIRPDETLSSLLEDGTIDAILSSHVPDCFHRQAQNVGRLFPDFQNEEVNYFRRTGIHPIMHVLVMRRDLAMAYPWLPSEIYRAYCDAKSAAVAELEGLSTLPVTLPWAAAELHRTKALMGADYWPYGLQSSKTTVDTFLRYLCEQGLIGSAPRAEELFIDVDASQTEQPLRQPDQSRYAAQPS